MAGQSCRGWSGLEEVLAAPRFSGQRVQAEKVLIKYSRLDAVVPWGSARLHLNSEFTYKSSSPAFSSQLATPRRSSRPRRSFCRPGSGAARSWSRTEVSARTQSDAYRSDTALAGVPLPCRSEKSSASSFGSTYQSGRWRICMHAPGTYVSMSIAADSTHTVEEIFDIRQG